MDKEQNPPAQTSAHKEEGKERPEEEEEKKDATPPKEHQEEAAQPAADGASPEEGEEEEEVIPTDIPTFDPKLKESDLDLPKDCFILPKQNDGFQIPYYLTSEEELSKVRPPAVVKTWEQRYDELDEKQKATFNEFVEEVKKAPWYEEERYDKWYCLRYLVARSFDIKKAFKMLEATAKWIKEFNYDDKNQCEICLKDPNQHMGQFIGWDKQYRPVMMMSMRWGPERKNPLQHMVCCFKHLIRMMPVGVEKWVCVTDFESYSHLKDGKPSMGLGVINVIQNHFPERLGKMICVNPPSMFWFLWKAFYSFIDPVTREKVEFVYTDDKPSIYDSFPKLFPYVVRGVMYDTYNRSKNKQLPSQLVWTPDPEGYPKNYEERKERMKASKENEKEEKKAAKEAEKIKKEEEKKEAKERKADKRKEKASTSERKSEMKSEKPEEQS